MKNALYLALALALLVFLVRYFYFKPMLVFGQPAPDFTAPGMQGDSIRLQDHRDYYVLLDFWGSWCGPCRAENPILSMLHQRYENQVFQSAKGIRFISVALDRDPEAARAAIEKDQLRWPMQILQQEMMDGPVAKLYGIKSIPTKYLIGPDGRIILANPDIKELDDYLAKDAVKN